jgi:cell division protein FtsQ
LKRPGTPLPKSSPAAKPAKVIKLERKPKRDRKTKLPKQLRAEVKRFSSQSRMRRAIVFSALGSFLVLLALVAASVLTPMLAVEDIQVKGLDRIPQKAILQILKKQIGKPLPLVNADEIGKDLEKFPLIESFLVVSQPPHSLLLKVRERQPIVIVYSGGSPYLYDPAGVQLGKAAGNDLYPILTITGAPKNSAEFKAAIDVLLALPADLLPKLSSIDAKSKDDVSMQLRGYAGQKIIWGDGSKSVLKSKVLAALIKNQNRTDRVTYDVSSPTAPVVRY